MKQRGINFKITKKAKSVQTKTLPAWKSMPTASDVPDTGTRASDLSDGSKGIPRMPSCTEYNKKEPTPNAKRGEKKGSFNV